MNREQLLRLYPRASEDFLRRNADTFVQGKPTRKQIVKANGNGVSRVCVDNPDQNGDSGFVPRVKAKPVEVANNLSTDEAKLNKTERARLEYIRRLPQITHLHTQAVTLKLAHDCRLTPDFFYYDTTEERFIAEDVKGFQREDALIKMKVAARMFPEFSFQIVFKHKSDWTIKEVKP